LAGSLSFTEIESQPYVNVLRLVLLGAF